MKNLPLIIQFRLTFAWVVIASIVATIITYVFVVFMCIKIAYKSVYPANYYEEQIPVIDEYIREKNEDLISKSAEKELQSIINGNGILYQMLDNEGNIIYGTNQERIFDTKEELFKRFNTTFGRNGVYIHTVPIIEGDGKIIGAVTLSYILKVSYVTNNGRWEIVVIAMALLSPFIYIVIFTLIFSKIFVKNINYPLEILMESSRKIKEKELDFEINYHSGNELGKLCDAFSEMKDGLEKSLSAQWKMEQERVEMVEALAHDLKTPLSIVRGYAEALINSNENSNEKLCRYLLVIKENAEKGSILVEQMQYTSELERIYVQLQLIHISLFEFMEQKIGYYELQAIQKNIDISLKIQDDVPTTILIDVGRLERILDNIVSNSLDYTPMGGSVRIFIKIEKEKILYEICDSGIGFTPKDIEKAFNKFYRGDEARMSEGNHSGLGLYIVKQLVEQLGGSIVIDNLKSGGASVMFWHKMFR